MLVALRVPFSFTRFLRRASRPAAVNLAHNLLGPTNGGGYGSDRRWNSPVAVVLSQLSGSEDAGRNKQNSFPSLIHVHEECSTFALYSPTSRCYVLSWRKAE